MNDNKPYGDITVTWIDTEQTSDFCIRTFSLKKVPTLCYCICAFLFVFVIHVVFHLVSTPS